MDFRIVRAQAPPRQFEEVARQWSAFRGAKMPRVPRFHHAHFGTGQEANSILCLKAWEQPPDQATMEPLMQELQAQVVDVSAGRSVIEKYDAPADF